MRETLQVSILTPLGKGGEGGIDRIMDNIRDRHASTSKSAVSLSFLTTRGQNALALMPGYFIASAIALIAKRLTGRIDLVHINLSSHGSVLRKLNLARLCATLGLPYVIHLHGSRFQHYWDGLNDKASSNLKKMFENATAIYVLGTIWADYIRQKAPAIAKSIVILPNATPRHIQTADHRAGRPVRVLFLGAIGQRKGVPDLIAALSLLKVSSEWRATIAGNGDLREAKNLAGQLNLTAQIDFPGWVGPDGVHEMLTNADILVLPSYDENLPMSVIEGMAAGLAILTTPVGATPDIIIEDQTGLLITPGDVGNLSAKLSKLINDKQLRQRLGKNAQHFHNHNLELSAYVTKLENLWLQAANKAKICREMV